MKVVSSDFENNGIMPRKHTGFGEDVSPEFLIDELPEGTVSLAIIMDDLDVPFRKPFTHWVIWNIMPTKVIPRGIPKGKVINTPICAVQGSAWGKHVYRGPKQPFFIKKEHRYMFYVHALDCTLQLTESAGKKELICAMNGHVLAEAKLAVRYKPE